MSRARGMPGFFSSPRAFNPAVGPRIDPQAPRGYYIDFRPKGPPIQLGRPELELHVATAQWGMGAYERYLEDRSEESLGIAIRAADVLIDRQLRDGPQAGGLPHHWPMPHTYRLDPPWLSGIAQGEAASLLVRVHATTGDARYAEAAVSALRPLSASRGEGGLRVPLGSGFFCEEYPTDPPSMVLNGGIFALWGYLDVALALADPEARREFERGLDAVAASIDRWDTGRWTLYDLYPHRLANVASPFYHVLHVNQLLAMERVAPRPELRAAAARFERYRESRRRRAGALARKVAFRVAVPRNPRLARLSALRPGGSRG